MTKIVKTQEEWRSQLTPMEFEVSRNSATERAFSGKFWDHHEPGTYVCVCCGTPLFESDTKFDSGCGWPSYFKAINPENVREKKDSSHGMTRTEILCNICDAHLGHVFPDGPETTGKRYCINGVVLRFVKDEKSSTT